MKDLIEKLEAATEGSRELDVEIALAIGFITEREGNVCYGNRDHSCLVLEKDYYDNGSVDELPHFSTSLDAALKVVPAGRYWIFGGGPKFSASVQVCDDFPATSSKAPSGAIALCIAALRARSAQ